MKHNSRAHSIEAARQLLRDLPNKRRRARSSYGSPNQLQLQLFAGSSGIGAAPTIVSGGGPVAPGHDQPGSPGGIANVPLTAQGAKLRDLAFQRSLIQSGEPNQLLVGRHIPGTCKSLALLLDARWDPRFETMFRRLVN